MNGESNREREGERIGESWHAFVSAATACMHACVRVSVSLLLCSWQGKGLSSPCLSPIYLPSGACVCIYFYVNACVSVYVCMCMWQCTIRRNNKTQLLQIVKLNISHKQQQRQQHNGTAAAAAASHNNNNSRSWPNWNCKCPWHDYRYFLCVCCMHSCVTRGACACLSITAPVR